MKSRTLAIAAFAVLLFAALLLRLHTLDASYWSDEVLTHNRASGSLQKALTVSPNVLPTVLSHFALKVDDSEVLLRMPSLLAGMGTVALLSLFCTKLAGKGFGLLCCILIATSPFHVYHSQEARYYSLLMLFAVSLLICATYFHSGKARGWPLAGMTLSTAAGFLCHPFFLLFTVGILAGLALCALMDLIQRKDVAFGKSYGAAFLAIGLGYAPLAYQWGPQIIATLSEQVPGVEAAAASTGQAEAETLGHTLSFEEYLSYVDDVAGSLLPGGVYVVLGFCLVGFAGLVIRHRLAALSCLAVLLAAPVILIPLKVDHWYSDRYFSYLLPAAVLLCAAGIYTILLLLEHLTVLAWTKAATDPRRASWGYGATALCGCAGLLALYAPHATGELTRHYENERPLFEWREMAEHMAREANNRDMIFYASGFHHDDSGGSYYEITLEFYLKRLLPEPGPLLARARKHRLSGLDKAALREALNEAPQSAMWIVAKPSQLDDEMLAFIERVADANPVRGDASLYVVGEPTVNILNNTDFATVEEEGWSPSAGQEAVDAVYNGEKRKVLKIHSDQPDINRSVRFPISAEDTQARPLREGHTYTLSFYLRAKDVQPGKYWSRVAKIVVGGHRADGTDLWVEQFQIRETHPWRRYTVHLTPGRNLPADIEQADIVIGLFGGTGTIWVDRVQLEEKPYPTVYTTGERLPVPERFETE
ncbi:MAG: glycosyltransferase family 39 protein [Candidatus Hydrogenedentota bacterium]